jgi:hypothetical protein
VRRALPLVAIAVAAAYVIAFRMGESGPANLAFDVYFYFYPNVLYALRSLAAGGSGLFWNPFQNCGQPFLANIETGLFYPLNALFLLLEPHIALRGLLFGNLLIGGLGSYGLARELGVSRVAALGGALSFVLGSAAFHVTLWMPTVQAPFVWLPAVMWCCERLLKVPSLRTTLLLALVLAAAFLPGHPQFVLFNCLMVGLRLLWSLFDRSERGRLPRALAGITWAFVVMLLLGSVVYLPALEVVVESVRSASLRGLEIAPQGNLGLASIGHAIRAHIAQAPFGVAPAALAAAALASATHRRAALFYSLAGLLFFVLGLGDATPLGRLWSHSLPGQSFREPIRFMVVTGFCVAVLGSLAIDVLARGSWAALALAVAGLLGLHVWLHGFAPGDWWLAVSLLACGLLAAAAPPARTAARLAMVGTLALLPVVSPWLSSMRLSADDSPWRAHAPLFEDLRSRMTPQERVHLARPHADPGFQDKTATLFGLRAVTDYENQVTHRYAEYQVAMLQGQPLLTVNQVYFPGLWPQSIQWRLVDLAAVRYLALPEGPGRPPGVFGGQQLEWVIGDAGVGIYRNPSALPRAYYLPHIAVEPDPGVRVRRLAAGIDDRRRLALVETAPPSGFLGVPGNQAISEMRFALDEPERVVLEGVAPERGFVFLADQYFPGWSARVNGQPAPIALANHAFRLVEVPKGPAIVEFRYSPPRFWIGALVSALTLTAVLALLVMTARRRENVTSAGEEPSGGGP